MATIPNPPNAPAGYVAKWNGNEWVVVPLTADIVPPKPENLPEGYTAEWDGSQWVIKEPPPPTPAPSPDILTGQTINTAVQDLQTIAYLTTQEMSTHITPESKAEVTQYIHDVANILATAQEKYGTGEAYTPEFPPTPSVVPQTSNPNSASPFIQFIVVP